MNELDLFIAANAIADPAERAAYLERVCADQPELRRRLEALLAGNAQSRHPLDQPPSHPPGAVDDATLTHGDPAATGSFRPAPSAEEAEGTIIAGRYKLRQQIGEGGMGTVWMADQTEPVKRKVAVKLIRVERGQSKTILARFEAERQAIALMDHPHIAKLLDAGTTETGSPFFVMELVKGIPLSDYCDQHRLTIAERLNLFQQICSAVQHAHQKGIIHRDLKPGNILVESHDGKPVPKVIDFGLAKATTGLQLSEQSMFTAFGSVMGTPLYMAPEQANFNAIDVDTRADVYALGVILYEMLTGTTPITRDTLKKAALDEMLRLIREQEAPTPSSRLSSADSLPSVSANRQIEPAKLGRFVKGELDWIVLKALSKDRDRRYETANGFARDIERFLNHEPVSAGPPSARYRLRKFVRRNRGQVIAASLVLFALLAGIAGTTVGLIEAKRQERLAVAAQAAEAARADGERLAKQQALDAAVAEKAANAQAQARLAQIEKGNAVLTSIFEDLDIKKVKEGTEPLEAVLAKRLVKAAEQLEGEAIGDPLVMASLQIKLGETLCNLGFATEAIPLFRKARETRTQKLGADHAATLDSMGYLAWGYSSAGKYDLTLPLNVETLKLTKDKLGADHDETLSSMNNLAVSYGRARKLDLALPLFEETLKLSKVKKGPDHADTLSCMNNLAMGYLKARKLDLALPLLEETLTRRKAKQGADHPDTLQSMGNLAEGYRAIGKLDLALLKETLDLTKAKLGSDHPDTLTSMNNLAVGYIAAGKRDKALPLYEEAHKLMIGKLGVDHPDTLNTTNNLVSAYQAAGQQDKALRLLEEALTLIKHKCGPDSPKTVQRMGSLASAYVDAGDPGKALPLQKETLQILERELGRGHSRTLMAIVALGTSYVELGQLAEAIPLLEEAHPALLKSPLLGYMQPDPIVMYVKAGKTAEAASLFAVIRKRFPKDFPEVNGHLPSYGQALLNVKSYVEAEPLLRELLADREKTQPDAWRTFNACSLLGAALLGQTKYADAEPLLLKGYEGMKAREKTITAAAGRFIPEALDRLIELYTATNKPDEVKQWQEVKAKLPKPEAPKPPEKK